MKKIEDCQQIESDLSSDLISNADSYTILPKLETLRLKLAKLYFGSEETEITKKKPKYKEIISFILSILSLDDIQFQLKLKYLGLTIKLLEKNKDFQFNEKFIGALNLLKSFPKRVILMNKI